MRMSYLRGLNEITKRGDRNFQYSPVETPRAGWYGWQDHHCYYTPRCLLQSCLFCILKKTSEVVKGCEVLSRMVVMLTFHYSFIFLLITSSTCSRVKKWDSYMKSLRGHSLRISHIGWTWGCWTPRFLGAWAYGGGTNCSNTWCGILPFPNRLICPLLLWTSTLSYLRCLTFCLVQEGFHRSYHLRGEVLSVDNLLRGGFSHDRCRRVN